MNQDEKAPLGVGAYKRILVTAALPYANGPVHIAIWQDVIYRQIFMCVTSVHKKEM